MTDLAAAICREVSVPAVAAKSQEVRIPIGVTRCRLKAEASRSSNRTDTKGGLTNQNGSQADLGGHACHHGFSRRPADFSRLPDRGRRRLNLRALRPGRSGCPGWHRRFIEEPEGMTQEKKQAAKYRRRTDTGPKGRMKRTMPVVPESNSPISTSVT